MYWSGDAQQSRTYSNLPVVRHLVHEGVLHCRGAAQIVSEIALRDHTVINVRSVINSILSSLSKVVDFLHFVRPFTL